MNAVTTAQCHRCGRTLTSARSIKAGYGKGCAARISAAKTAADLAEYKDAQIESAQELIADGAILPLRGRIYLAVSNDGSATHRTATTGQCTCPAGLKGIRCYHVAAARILAAA
jgi:hypothetical protein